MLSQLELEAMAMVCPALEYRAQGIVAEHVEVTPVQADITQHVVVELKQDPARARDPVALREGTAQAACERGESAGSTVRIAAEIPPEGETAGWARSVMFHGTGLIAVRL